LKLVCRWFGGFVIVALAVTPKLVDFPEPTRVDAEAKPAKYAPPNPARLIRYRQSIVCAA
jgi:hypothetical protein